MKNVCIGSQLYINKGDSPEHIAVLVRKMHRTKLKLIRLFMVWDTVEPRQDKWDFSLFDACFDEASRCNMGVIPTLMPVSPPGWKKRTMGSQDIDNIDDPVIWKEGLAYVRKIVSRYEKHPALHSWILWNEPSRNVSVNASNIDDFYSFLLRKYGSIEAYNRCHYRLFSDKNDFIKNYLSSCEVLAFKPYSEEIDLLTYSEYNLCKHLCDIRDEIRKTDSHPVHVNPHDVARESYTNGQNFYEEGKIVDFLGCSAHPSWHSIDFYASRIPLSIGYFADVMKAFSKTERFWVSELQGGTNIFSGRKYMCPDKKDIGVWLAEAISSGAETSVFWCFNTRDSGFEGGEWGLLNQLEEDSPRTEAVREFAEVLEKNQELFDLSHAETPDIYILYSDDTIRLNMVETAHPDGILRDKNNGRFSVIGAYMLARDAGLTPALVGEKNLSTLPENAFLLLPDTYALEEDVVSSLRDFVQNGGTVFADGLIGMKDRYGKITPHSLLIFEEIFGGKVRDIAASDQKIEVFFGKNAVETEFLQVDLLPTSGKKEGDILVNAFGKGQAVRVPSVLFRNYRKTENKNTLLAVKNYLPKPKKIRLENADKDFYMRTLISGQGKIVFIFNMGEKKTARLLGVEKIKVLRGNPYTDGMKIDKKEYAILYCEEKKCKE